MENIGRRSMMFIEKYSWLALWIIASVARRRVSNGDAAGPSRLRLPSSGGAVRRLLIGFCPQDKVVIRTRFVQPTTMLPERATLRPALRGEEPAAREPGSGGWGDRDRGISLRWRGWLPDAGRDGLAFVLRYQMLTV